MSSKCIICKNKQPTFNFKGEKPGLTINLRNHCEKHCTKDEIKFFTSTCGSCGLDDVIVDGNNLCEVCDPDVFQKYKKRKQEEVLKLFQANGLGDFIGYDKSIESIYKEGCDLKTRPDFLWDCGTHFLVVEVDENKHTSYECDVPRMINISQALGLPTFFIRYNPDNFKINNRISKINNKDLVNFTKYYKNITELKYYCSYIQLFFDDYKKDKVEIMKLLDFDE